MDYGISSAQMIDVDRVFLDLGNPRHEPFVDQDAAIDYLCRNEQVLQLARDIAENGLNPLELFALIPDGDDAYLSTEGNRRLCALMLLIDPDLAPADFRSDFDRIANSWTPIRQLFAIVFKNRDEVRLWLDRIHAGFAEGRGRRQWNAEQKARNSGYSKNVLAQRVLDAGRQMAFITEDQRKGRLSTVQRYLGNPHMRNALGLNASNLERITTDLSEDDFGIVFRRFMEDVAAKKITTRADSAGIQSYANKISHLDGVSGKRGESRPIATMGKPRKEDPERKPKRPKKPQKLPFSEHLYDALSEIPSYKLEKMYYSLCSLKLDDHTPLLSVGTWSFVETLTALVGRNVDTSFHSYLSAQKLKKLGVGGGKETKPIREAFARLSEFGNTTKHHQSAAAFNGDQLANDVETIEGTLVALAKEARPKT